MRVVSKQSGALERGCELSTAVGRNADGLAGAARSKGIVYEADIPVELINLLEEAGLVQRGITRMGSGAAQELKFSGAVSEYIYDFFKVRARGK